MNTNKIILDFLIDWLSWAESKSANEPEFKNKLFPIYSSADGLCSSLIIYSYKFPIAKNLDELDEIESALKTMFQNDGLYHIYPFGSSSDFIKRTAEQTHHECPVRLAWVKKTIKHLRGISNE